MLESGNQLIKGQGKRLLKVDPCDLTINLQRILKVECNLLYMRLMFVRPWKFTKRAGNSKILAKQAPCTIKNNYTKRGGFPNFKNVFEQKINYFSKEQARRRVPSSYSKKKKDLKT